MPTDAELAQLDGMRWVLVKCFRKPPAPWWKEHHTVKPGGVGMEDVGAVKACPECYQFIPATSEEARDKVEYMANKNPGLRLTPIDGSEAHPLDVRNTYRTFNDGRLFAEVNGSSGAGHFLGRLRHEASQLTTRATNVDALLDHHLSGTNPIAFVEFIRGEVLTWKSGRGPSPNSVKGWLASKGMLSDNALTEDPWQVDRCERWLDRASVERVGAVGATTKPAKEWPDLKSLALFHAYRFEYNDASADITKVNFEQVASAGGFTAKSSGKGLLAHFQRYACGEPDNKRIERTKEGKRRGDTLNRLSTVIGKLEAYPEARAMAEDERKAVRARSNKDED